MFTYQIKEYQLYEVKSNQVEWILFALRHTQGSKFPCDYEERKIGVV